MRVNLPHGVCGKIIFDYLRYPAIEVSQDIGAAELVTIGNSQEELIDGRRFQQPIPSRGKHILQLVLGCQYAEHSQVYKVAIELLGEVL